MNILYSTIFGLVGEDKEFSCLRESDDFLRWSRLKELILLSVRVREVV